MIEESKKESKKAAEIWIKELIYPESIKSKIKEAEEELRNYKKLCKSYNWNNNVVNDNITSMQTFINTLKKAI